MNDSWSSESPTAGNPYSLLQEKYRALIETNIKVVLQLEQTKLEASEKIADLENRNSCLISKNVELCNAKQQLTQEIIRLKVHLATFSNQIQQAKEVLGEHENDLNVLNTEIENFISTIILPSQLDFSFVEDKVFTTHSRNSYERRPTLGMRYAEDYLPSIEEEGSHLVENSNHSKTSVSNGQLSPAPKFSVESDFRHDDNSTSSGCSDDIHDSGAADNREIQEPSQISTSRPETKLKFSSQAAPMLAISRDNEALHQLGNEQGGCSFDSTLRDNAKDRLSYTTARREVPKIEDSNRHLQIARSGVFQNQQTTSAIGNTSPVSEIPRELAGTSNFTENVPATRSFKCENNQSVAASSYELAHENSLPIIITSHSNRELSVPTSFSSNREQNSYALDNLKSTSSRVVAANALHMQQNNRSVTSPIRSLFNSENKQRISANTISVKCENTQSAAVVSSAEGGNSRISAVIEGRVEPPTEAKQLFTSGLTSMALKRENTNSQNRTSMISSTFQHERTHPSVEEAAIRTTLCENNLSGIEENNRRVSNTAYENNHRVCGLENAPSSTPLSSARHKTAENTCYSKEPLITPQMRSLIKCRSIANALRRKSQSLANQNAEQIPKISTTNKETNVSSFPFVLLGKDNKTRTLNIENDTSFLLPSKVTTATVSQTSPEIKSSAKRKKKDSQVLNEDPPPGVMTRARSKPRKLPSDSGETTLTAQLSQPNLAIPASSHRNAKPKPTSLKEDGTAKKSRRGRKKAI